MSAEQIETVLADFRMWLRENASSVPAIETPVPPDLHTLLGHMVRGNQRGRGRNQDRDRAHHFPSPARM